MATNTSKTNSTGTKTNSTATKSKPSRRRMKKQVRRTIAGLFMASAIAIAAIPVEQTSASQYGGNDTTYNGPIKIAVYDDKWPAGTTSPINKTYTSQIPYISDNPTDQQTIYSTGDGWFQFGTVTSSTGKAAVIVKYSNGEALPGGALVIPEKAEAFLPYEGKGELCAVNNNDLFLYYKDEVYKKNSSDAYELKVYLPALDSNGVPDYNSSSYYYETVYSNMAGVVTGEFPNFKYNRQEKNTAADENYHTTEYECTLVKVIGYNPCLYSTYDKWKNLSYNELYYYPDNKKTAKADFDIKETPLINGAYVQAESYIEEYAAAKPHTLYAAGTISHPDVASTIVNTDLVFYDGTSITATEAAQEIGTTGVDAKISVNTLFPATVEGMNFAGAYLGGTKVTGIYEQITDTGTTLGQGLYYTAVDDINTATDSEWYPLSSSDKIVGVYLPASIAWETVLIDDGIPSPGSNSGTYTYSQIASTVDLTSDPLGGTYVGYTYVGAEFKSSYSSGDTMIGKLSTGASTTYPGINNIKYTNNSGGSSEYDLPTTDTKLYLYYEKNAAPKTTTLPCKYIDEATNSTISSTGTINESHVSTEVTLASGSTFSLIKTVPGYTYKEAFLNGSIKVTALKDDSDKGIVYQAEGSTEWVQVPASAMLSFAYTADSGDTILPTACANESEGRFIVPVSYIGNEAATGDKFNGWKLSGTVNKPLDGVFAGQKGNNISNLTIGDNILGVGNYAFYECNNLTTVTFGNGLATLGNSAFEFCRKLESCSIPDNAKITCLGMETFKGCSALTSFTPPTNVQAIGDACFENCTALQSIKLDATGTALRHLGYHVFRNCSALREISLPPDFSEEMDIDLIEGCANLTHVTVRNQYADFVDVHSKNGSVDENGNATPKNFPCNFNFNVAFGNTDYSLLESFYFEGPGTTDISIKLEGGVYTVKDPYNALHNTAINEGIAFKYLDQDIYEKVVTDSTSPNNYAAIYRVNSKNELTAFISDGVLANVNLPGKIGPYGISIIGSDSFSNNCDLQKINIPFSVQEISGGAFKGCHNLKAVIFEPDSGGSYNYGVKIGPGAFATQVVDKDSTCTKPATSSDTFPSYNHTLDKNEDDFCLSFTGPISDSNGNEFPAYGYAMNTANNINVGAQPTTYIKYYTGFPTMQEIQLRRDYLDNEPDGGFQYFKTLVDYPSMADLIAIKDGVADLDKYPFLTQDDINALKEAYNKSVTPNASLSQDEQAIIDAALNVVVPAGVQAIDDGLFSGLDANGEVRPGYTPDTTVKTITVSSIDNIDPYTFAGLEALKKFKSNGGTSIGDYAFDGDKNLDQVSIAASVQEMGMRPFRGCENLKAVGFDSGSPFSCKDAIIFGNNGASVVECLESRGIVGVGSSTISSDELAGVTAIKEEAFMNCDNITAVDLVNTGITVIPERAFAATDKLGQVLCPEGLRTIDTDAFLDSAASSVSIPGDKTSIAENAFAETKYGDSDSGDEGKPTLQGYQDTNNPYKPKDEVKRQVKFYTPADSTADFYADKYPYIEVSPTKMTFKVQFFDSKADDPNTPVDVQYVEQDGFAVRPADPQHPGHKFTGWLPAVETTPITAPKDFFAMYEGETFTVTFVDYDMKTVLDVQTVNYGGNAMTPPAPTRDGYTFIGWLPEYTNVIKDLTIIAQYDKIDSSNKHVVTFHGYNDTIISTQLVEDGKAAKTPSTPTAPGYTFVGWIPKDFTNVTADMDIYAQFEKDFDKHLVTFYDYDDSILSEQFVEDGGAAIAPANPYRAGYTFIGWVPSDFGYITADLDIHAQYEKTEPISSDDTFIVTFYDYDEKVLSVQEIKKNGAAVTPVSPTRDGYTFKGWLPSDYSNVTSDMRIYAQYEKNSSTPPVTSLSFDVIFYNYDDTIVSQQIVPYGKAASTPTSPARAGYKFVGWKPSNYSNVTHDMAIYAQFDKDESNKTATHTVTVVNGSGSGTYAVGTTVVIAANTPPNGKTFSKWTTGDVKLASDSLSATTFTMPDKNVTVTANYVDGGNGNSVNTATGNAARPSSTIATVTGYTPVSGVANTNPGAYTNGGPNSGVSTAGLATAGNSPVVVSKGGVSGTDLATATVHGSTDSFVVKVSESNEATYAVENALLNRYGNLSNLDYWACDISLYDATGTTKITDTTGLVVDVTIPLPDSLRGYGGNNRAGAVVNNQLEDLGTKFNTVNGVPTITFTATHFSPYVIYVDKNNLNAAEFLDTSPKTGDPIHPKWFLAIGLAASSIALFMKKDKKRKPAIVS